MPGNLHSPTPLLVFTFHLFKFQGIHCGMQEDWGWGTEECLEQTKRLEYHPGFPNGQKLRCPAFTGDKFAYICASSLTLPTFKVLHLSLSSHPPTTSHPLFPRTILTSFPPPYSLPLSSGLVAVVKEPGEIIAYTLPYSLTLYRLN